MQRNNVTIDDMVCTLERIANEPGNGWIGNVSDELTEELHRCDLVWRDGEYLCLSDRGQELLVLATASRAVLGAGDAHKSSGGGIFIPKKGKG